MENRFQSWATSRRISAALAVSVVIGSVAVLAGWLFGISVLKAWLPGRVPMNPATAVALLLASVSLGLFACGRFRSVGLLTALVVAGVGAGCVTCYWAEANFRIDRILFYSDLGNNRMAPNTGFCLFLAGAALAALRHERVRRLAEAGGSVLASWSFLSVIGYVFGSRSLYGIGGYIPMAINTALMLHLVGLGVVLVSGKSWLAWIVDTSTPGTVLARRLVVAAVAAPLMFGWMQLRGQLSGLYDAQFGSALLVVATTIVLLGVVAWAVKSVDRAMSENAAMQARLREQDLQYRLLVEGIHDYAIFLLDPAGNVRTWNDGARRIMGYGSQEILGQSFSCFYPAEDAAREKPVRELEEAARQGRIRDEGWRVRRDGTRFWASSLITAIFNDDGTLTGFSKITRDMTAQREYQLGLADLNDELERRVERRTRELSEANRDLAEKNRENETFVYSVSHDLRSPLVNLQGFSTELERSCGELVGSLKAEAVSEELRRHLAEIMDSGMREPIYFIRTAVTRLSTIIDALLRLSRAGRVEYQVRSVDLNEVVRRILDSMRVTLSERGAELVLHPLAPARGDATALEQIFANLIGNALNYLDPSRQGVIEIGLLQDAPASDENGPRQTYFVRDNGLGIPAAYQGKVFQAFQRLHPSSAPGEGMGLTLVRRIVERHGGRIWLESTEGEGTTFFVSLPSGASADESSASPAGPDELVSEPATCRAVSPQEELCHAC
ncbi:MAG TPA: ATP-binding protein [Pirellulales bacterium]|nr:ATP-binding protein [Pirellulales bacterium]